MTAPSEQVSILPSTGKTPDVLRPPCADAARAMIAIEQNRLEDAERAVTTADEKSFIDRAWKRFIQGRLAFERTRLTVAERALHEAASFAYLTAGADEDTHPQTHALRLAARTRHELGRLFRRLERLADARQAHLAAWRLREQVGTTRERWETAMELALDEDLARNWHEAERWLQSAIALAEDAGADSDRLAGDAWGRLALTRTNACRFEEARLAADTACRLWRKHDSGCAEVALAEARRAEVLLKYGESLLDQHDDRARSILESAVSSLDETIRSLCAFGGRLNEYATTLQAQREFADQLLASTP